MPPPPPPRPVLPPPEYSPLYSSVEYAAAAIAAAARQPWRGEACTWSTADLVVAATADAAQRLLERPPPETSPERIGAGRSGRSGRGGRGAGRVGRG